MSAPRVDIPLLRKDFTLDPVQIAEARVAGADWVLLIVALLDADALDLCLAGVARSGAHAIVEVHDVDEAAHRRRGGSRVHRHQQPRPAHAGHRPRDLRAGALGAVPTGVVCVAESGVRSPG